MYLSFYRIVDDEISFHEWKRRDIFQIWVQRYEEIAKSPNFFVVFYLSFRVRWCFSA